MVANKVAKKKPAAKKLAAKKPATKKPAKKAAAKKPATTPSKKAGRMVPPDWGCVFPPTVTPSTGDAAIDAALQRLIDGESTEKDRKLLARAPAALIATFAGPALIPGTPYHDDDEVEALTPGEKRARTKVYWAAESAKNQREGMIVAFCGLLAESAEGRAYLLKLAREDHAARVRKAAAEALQAVDYDEDLQRKIADALDPSAWVGRVEADSSTWLGHAYSVGACARMRVDPEDAVKRFAPLLVPNGEPMRAESILWAIRSYPDDDVEVLAGFVPHLVKLIADEDLYYPAMFALVRLPVDRSVAERARQKLGKTTESVEYWDEWALKLLAKAPIADDIPYFALALADSWMKWRTTFEALDRIGDPFGIAIIEAWFVEHQASDRTEAAEPILARLRKIGEPTAEQRAQAAAWFPSKKAKTKRRG